MTDALYFLGVLTFLLALAFFGDEPKDCTNVWNSMQRKAMGKECPKQVAPPKEQK